MHAHSYSRTAEAMAAIRAVEYAAYARDERILSDPYAIHFIFNRVWRWAAARRWTARLLSAAASWWLPGGQEYALARARFVDLLVTAEARRGLQQLVLLGAGFDTTVYRLREELAAVRVFEIDHPATQEVKKAVVKQLGLPADVLFLPVDFEKEDFAERLLASEFVPGRLSFITWLGVSYYLTAPAVARTLCQAAELLGRDDHFVFDFVLEYVVAQQGGSRAARLGFRKAARWGEPFRFGLRHADVASYLAGCGLELVEQCDSDTLFDRTCPEGRRPVDFTRIAVCRRLR